LPAFTPDELLSNPGRRPSGARLYHRGSIFSEPVCCRIDRAQAWRLIADAEALDRATRQPGQHGGVLKRSGVDVLRALLRRFYSYATGACFPSYDEIAEAAGCCRATVAAKLRVLEQYGFIQTIRRKMVVSFISRVARVRFDVAVQTSNSYTFSLPIGELAPIGATLTETAEISAVTQPQKAGSKIWPETSKPIKKMPIDRDLADLAAEKARWIAALLGDSKVG
jgi:DNA-binding transcriptional regulator YhcF (GntR family)